MKASRKELVAAQKKCFKQVFKYEAGMICAACNGNYGKFITKNADGSFTMKVKKDTCARLQKACYSYLVERATATKYIQNQAKAKKNSEPPRRRSGSSSKLGTRSAVALTPAARRTRRTKFIKVCWTKPMRPRS